MIAVFALSVSAARSRDRVRCERRTYWVRRLVLAYGALALALALRQWWAYRDWVHLLWTTTHPQLVLFSGAGAFLSRDARIGRGPWIVVASLLVFALLPAALIQWAPDIDAEPRNLGRPIAGTLEVAHFGLGGPLPAVLVPENQAGVARGLGFLPREITVPIGALAVAAVLWIVVCFVLLTGTLLRPPRLRAGYLVLAPFGALALLWVPMPFGLNESTLWPSDPALLRGFGPLLVTAALASALVPLARWLARRSGEAPDSAP